MCYRKSSQGNLQVSLYSLAIKDDFGEVMSSVKPRMAIAFHTVLLPEIHHGPLTIANDLTVWNVTKETIAVREAVFPDRVTAPPTSRKT